MSALMAIIAAFGLAMAFHVTFWQGFWFVFLAYALAPYSRRR